VRADGRRPDQLRPTRITLDVQKFADASAMIDCGDTRVLCAVSVEEGVPPFLAGRGSGWLTAEYRMLPRATTTRNARETRPRGRTQEIQRLIGRALRAVVDLRQLGERTLLVDCDVLQADGGTRTAAVTGAFVALRLAVRRWQADGVLTGDPVVNQVAAVSAGIVRGSPMLDLCYTEDSAAETDLNAVMTAAGEIVEVQATAEGSPMKRHECAALIELAAAGIQQLAEAQNQILAGS
jgi:ribonuclease PH